jgi:hypothetical protein
MQLPCLSQLVFLHILRAHWLVPLHFHPSRWKHHFTEPVTALWRLFPRGSLRVARLEEWPFSLT